MAKRVGPDTLGHRHSELSLSTVNPDVTSGQGEGWGVVTDGSTGSDSLGGRGKADH